ncbi:MAG: hypothetical protein WA184_12050 [Stellaceae bacterium]
MTARIALVHAVSVAIAPVEAAFRELWPAAECANILDDSLSLDRERDGALTAAMTKRILALAAYARSTGAAGILFTCSAFGEAIEAAAARIPVPVLKPNEAMFEAALAAGRRIACSRLSHRASRRWKTSSASSPPPAIRRRRSRPIACLVRWRR